MNTNFADFEKFADFEAVTAQGKKALQPIIEFNEITARALSALGRQQVEMFGETMDFGLQGMRAVTAADGVSELTSGQGRLATEYGNRVKEYAETALKTVTEAQKAYQNLATTVFERNSAAAAEATDHSS